MDGSCFLQGLTRVNESHAIMTCGGYGDSRVLIATGFDSSKIVTRVVFSAPSRKYFIEGCAIVGDKLFVLTWRENVVFELSMKNFSLVKTHSYPREGWGLTYNPDRDELWASDGSSSLFVLDSHSLGTIRSCKVTLSHDGLTSVPVRYINELEYIEGTIYANVYMESGNDPAAPNYVLGIDPGSCKVRSVLPVFGLRGPSSPGGVFNGIAQGFNQGELLVSGKLWKKMYAIQVDSTATKPDRLWTKFNITDFLSSNLSFR